MVKELSFEIFVTSVIFPPVDSLDERKRKFISTFLSYRICQSAKLGKQEFTRVAPYLVVTILRQFERVTVYPIVKVSRISIPSTHFTDAFELTYPTKTLSIADSFTKWMP